jgi:hypothetical protein
VTEVNVEKPQARRKATSARLSSLAERREVKEEPNQEQTKREEKREERTLTKRRSWSFKK